MIWKTVAPHTQLKIAQIQQIECWNWEMPLFLKTISLFRIWCQQHVWKKLGQGHVYRSVATPCKRLGTEATNCCHLESEMFPYSCLMFHFSCSTVRGLYLFSALSLAYTDFFRFPESFNEHMCCRHCIIYQRSLSQSDDSSPSFLQKDSAYVRELILYPVMSLTCC